MKTVQILTKPASRNGSSSTLALVYDQCSNVIAAYIYHGQSRVHYDGRFEGMIKVGTVKISATDFNDLARSHNAKASVINA